MGCSEPPRAGESILVSQRHMRKESLPQSRASLHTPRIEDGVLGWILQFVGGAVCERSSFLDTLILLWMRVPIQVS